MQTTLLGLAIAFIIALTTALIGPFFVDWNQYKPQFEAEASRMLGVPVRVAGTLDARLLPAPILRLRALSVGAPGDPSRMRADRLDVEFSLGSLMRGEWRASELSLGGVALELGLDRNGQIDWPASQRGGGLGAVAIDRVNVAGGIVLHDAASGTQLALDDVAFTGEVRTAGASTRGEGALTWSGVRLPFRVSTGQTPDDKGTRVHVIVDPTQRGLSADLDGVVTLDARRPRFDGVLMLAHALSSPWRISAKTKADAKAASFAQIDLAYGADDVALKLAGSGAMQFGAAPRFEVKLSAQQLDADRLLTKAKPADAGDAKAGVLQLIPGLRALVSAMPSAPLPGRIEIGVDQIALGGRSIRNVAVDLRSDAQGDVKGWVVDNIGLQAPGNTQITARGRVQGANADARFIGPLEISSAASEAFVGWLQGRSDVAYRGQKPARLAGEATIAADELSLDAMSLDLDGSALRGRLALTGAQFEAVLSAQSLDLDALAGFAGPLSTMREQWPQQARLSLDIAQAKLGGQDVRPLAVRLAYGPDTLALERLTIGDASDLALNGQGAFDRTHGTGTLTLDASASSFARMEKMIAPWAPAVAARLESLNVAPGPARAKLSVAMTRPGSDASRVTRAVLDLTVPQIKGTATLTTTARFDAQTGFDFAELGKNAIALDTSVSAERGEALVALLGLDSMIASKVPARLEASASGVWQSSSQSSSQSPWQFRAKLSGKDLDAQVAGKADPWASAPTASMTLAARHLDLAPLLDAKALPAMTDVSVAARLTLAGERVTVDDLDATLGATRARGHLTVTRGEETGIDGEIGLSELDLASATGLALGASGRAAAEPLGRGWLQGWRGRVAFEILRGVLPGGAELQSARGMMRGDGRSLVLEDVKAGLGGGSASASIEAKRGASGTAVQAQFQFTDVDGAALKYHSLAAPKGRTSLRMTLASEGRSAAALSNALQGDGVLTLNDARVVGLDAKAIDAAIAASDSAQSVNDAALEKIVAPVLSQGAFPVAAAQIPFDIRDGRWRVGATTLESSDARAIISGGYDLAADQVDIRAVLSSMAMGAQTTRPEIQVFWHGTPAALNRTVDIAALSSWIALRAIDRETRRLEQLEHASAPPATSSLPPAPPARAPRATVSAPANTNEGIDPPQTRAPEVPRKRNVVAKPAVPTPAPRIPDIAAPSQQQLAPLPPPIDIRPAPGSSRLLRPR